MEINQHRQAARNKAFQALLFGQKAQVRVSPDICFSFAEDPRIYAYSAAYRGRYEFRKHYYPEIGDLEGKGEEFECAQFIDGLDEIDFWVRNPVRRPGRSFWLQTSTDKFYPDFVCKLKDGRTAVVEYKGGHLMNYGRQGVTGTVCLSCRPIKIMQRFKGRCPMLKCPASPYVFLPRRAQCCRPIDKRRP